MNIPDTVSLSFRKGGMAVPALVVSVSVIFVGNVSLYPNLLIQLLQVSPISLRLPQLGEIANCAHHMLTS